MNSHIENPADFKAATVLLSTTLLLVVSNYRLEQYNAALLALGLYFLIPLGLIVLVFRESPIRYGLGWGDWRRSGRYLLLMALLVAVVLPFATRLPALRTYHTTMAVQGFDLGDWLFWAVTDGSFLFAWEFLFRGFLVFGLEERFGYQAVLVQAVPFALTHLTKPEIEALGALFGGLVLGYVALRTRSFWPAFLTHWLFYAGLIILVNRGGW